MKNKFRVLLATAGLVIGLGVVAAPLPTIAPAAVAPTVEKATAATGYANCTYSPPAPSNTTYAMSYCVPTAAVIGGTFWQIRITCKVQFNGPSYFHYGNTGVNGTWSRATCNGSDKVIHAFTTFSNPLVVFGTGSW